MDKTTNRNLLAPVACSIFVILSVWWLALKLQYQPSDSSLELFSGTYWTMAMFGGIIGLRIARLWGGRKSHIGRALQMFSVGLLAQVFGQITYSLYTLVLHEEVPYPSIGDIGYFGSVILYILGAVFLAQALSIHLSIKTYLEKIWALVLPAIIFVGSYFVFLKGHEFDIASPWTVFLDLGYPLGAAVYLSIAILVYLLSRRFLGGMMRPVILILLLALGMQYVADFMFLYQQKNDAWVTAGINDFVYLFAYFVMTMALIRFGVAYKKVSSSSAKAEK